MTALAKSVLFLIAVSVPFTSAGEAHVLRYVDPAQAALPFPYYSLDRQPWRSYLEVTPAATYLTGLGVVWGPAVAGKTDGQIASDLAWAGFRRVRIEFPWGAMRWDEEGADADFAARTASILRALKANGLRPLILLNAHHAAPCPLRNAVWRVARPVTAGERRIRVQGSAAGIVPMYSMVATLATSAEGGPLVTDVSATDGVLTLSKPISKDLPAGTALQISQLKYQPLFPVGTSQFESTAQGWRTYVAYVVHFVTAIYGADFDVEMWNELTFGSDFLDVNHYFTTPLNSGGPDFLHAGGSAWELARRTAAQIAQLSPQTRVIWGFSNTTFFHTAVSDLPPGFSGQSYHPYGVGPRCFAKIIVGREQYNSDGFVPSGCATMPEGWAQTFQQTESLMRLLSPSARAEHPPAVEHFAHYITEHGFSPAELGIHNGPQALAAKGKFLLRASLFWLNKGLAGFYVFDSAEAHDDGFGLLREDGTVSPALAALHRLTAHLHADGAAPGEPRKLDATLERVPDGGAVYANDPRGEHVSQQQLVALLPFAVSSTKLVVAMYVMTENFPVDLAPQRYRITLIGVHGSPTQTSYYDPVADRLLPLRSATGDTGDMNFDVELTDSPRLLEIGT
jgi:hypothetical protein